MLVGVHISTKWSNLHISIMQRSEISLVEAEL